jgi:protein phosphatase
MKLTIPEFALVVLIGASGSGKSTFAKKHFLPTEILSSDMMRGWIVDDENDQTVSGDVFDVLHYVAAKRLKHMKLVVVDATNVQAAARKPLIRLAQEYHALPVAIIIDVPEKIAVERNAQRSDRNFGRHVIAHHRQDLKRALKTLTNEGFRRIYHLKGVEGIETAVVERERLWNDFKHEHGPFDIIGDIHGCFTELVMLLSKLGYQVNGTSVIPPDGRKVVFVGDLCDRGRNTPDVLRLVMDMVKRGHAFAVPGNHDDKLKRALEGRDVQIKHGLAESLEQLQLETPEFRRDVRDFIYALVSHVVLDAGKLVVAHAGMREDLIGRVSSRVRDFALYGETTGETDEFGLPVRYNWAAEYRGKTTIVYGHTPVPEAEWLNNTINIDTGCVFGGKLTALRYPENELVSVEAQAIYAVPARPLLAQAPGLSAQQLVDDVLDIQDVIGKRVINTRLHHNITIREENATAALEVMSRYAVNPKWLIYLPATMSPVKTSNLPSYLEHPAEAFEYFRVNDISQIICEEKHMGSRALVVICKDEIAAKNRFGVVDEGIGIIYTRTGRRFFDDLALEAAFLGRINAAITAAGLWDELATTWMLLDCELMPWSAKAQGLLQNQYAAVGSAATASLDTTINLLQQNPAAAALLEHYQARQANINKYITSYRHYCWSVASIDDLKLAPFHLLASEGIVHLNKSHLWHMDSLAKIAAMDSALLMSTPYKIVNTTDETSQQSVIDWWLEMTSKGGEGMVVKPLDFVVRGKREILQPAVKVRGREYLRIIYGPEYTQPEHLERLRQRGLQHKRSMAIREFALGIEALERFVGGEPLRRVHECVFGVLALESEPVDPRL